VRKALELGINFFDTAQAYGFLKSSLGHGECKKEEGHLDLSEEPVRSSRYMNSDPSSIEGDHRMNAPIVEITSGKIQGT
jgi:hypothetical protein